MNSRALGLGIGFVLDRLLGDPRRWHPVAGFGQLSARLEERTYRDRRIAGVVHVGALVGCAVGVGVLAELAPKSAMTRVAMTALTTWVVLGGRSLEVEANRVGDLLEAGDIPAARIRLTHLVGRDPSGLDADEIARAVVESVAENTSDAVVAPLLWGAVAGIPGLLGYRAVNTLDAMIGYRNPRYEKFGWAAARLDDLANLPAARLGGLLVLVASPSRARESWLAWQNDAGAHPSPNAGVVEAAFAGSLGLRLGGPNRYGDRIERRATLGTGRKPGPDDIPVVTKMSGRVGWLAAATAVLVALGSGVSSRRPQ
jgi:adenosylcobinamide-phosphate synthase